MHCCILILQRTMKELYKIWKDKRKSHQIICSLWITFERNKKTMNFSLNKHQIFIKLYYCFYKMIIKFYSKNYCSLWITFERNVIIHSFTTMQYIMHYCILMLQRTMKELYKIWKDKRKSHQIICSLWSETKRQWTFLSKIIKR